MGGMRGIGKEPKGEEAGGEQGWETIKGVCWRLEAVQVQPLADMVVKQLHRAQCMHVPIQQPGQSEAAAHKCRHRHIETHMLHSYFPQNRSTFSARQQPPDEPSSSS